MVETSAHARPTAPSGPAVPAPHDCRPFAHASAELPRYSRLEARLARLGTAAGLGAWTLGAFGVRPTTARLDSPSRTTGSCVWVDLRYRGGLLRLGLPTVQVPALEAALAQDGPTAQTSPALRSAIAQRLLEPLLAVLDSQGISPVDIVATGQDEPGDLFASPWHITLHGESGQTLDAYIASAAAPWLDTLERQLKDSGDWHPLGWLRLPGCLVLGVKRIPVRALQSLRPGDAIMRALGPGVATDAGRPWEASIRWPRMRAPAGHACIHTAVRVEDSRLTIIERPCMDLDTPEDLPETDGDEEADTALPLNEIELPIQVELATAAMPIAEIAALRPGHVMELPCPVRDAQVRLTAFGQLIAHAELVTVGDHIGVRITSMAR